MCFPPVKPCARWPGTHRVHDGRPIIGKVFVYHITFRQAGGRLRPGRVLHHECEHRWCIEPTHLKQMTMADHLREHGLHGDHHQALKTHCPQGHPYSESNTYRWQGERQCRECVREAKRRYRARKKNA